MPVRVISLAAVFALLAVPAAASPAVRVKDLARVEGVRSNALIGYGLVVGLQGTGDGTQSEFTVQSVANLLKRSGVTVPQSDVRVRNVAAVMVTTDLPPFSRAGQRIDVSVASLGDAKSLQGGTLLMTPLQGPDGAVYAVAQGSVSLGGGFVGGSGGNSVQKNHPTSGRIPGGGSIERAAPAAAVSGDFRLLLDAPDFATASRLAAAINESFGVNLARAEDAVSVHVAPVEALAADPVSFVARVEQVEVRPDASARVVINERTGTVVLGSEVRVSAVAVSHGSLKVEVRTDLEASQPNPWAERGETVVVPHRDVAVDEAEAQVLTLQEGTSVADVVAALNAIGVSPRDMIAIFQAMHVAGALHAEIVVM